MTFSVVARCRESGRFGVAVCSSSPAVAARCSFARAGLGAAASQNITDPALGEAVLERLAAGEGARRAVEAIAVSGPKLAYRQLIAVDAKGETAVFSGRHSLGINAAARSVDVAAAGNLLADPEIPAAMVATFEESSGVLAERLLRVMRAAMALGGEAGPVHSIGLKIVDRMSWPYVDLRVDWAETDVVERLQALWDVYGPQADDYVTRALRPETAPGFGVPGDL
jgi:uncharacterized Ntn-hydrolase superfamily protein